MIHNTWTLYILRAEDNSLYTGVTTNLERRLSEHLGSTKGAKCLRGKRKLKLVYSESMLSRSEALTKEAEIKSWSKFRKEEWLARH